MNKDFIKKLLTEQKQLLQLSEVKYVHVPRYDELSVKKFWPILSQDQKLTSYMPDATIEDRLPDRTYFWNVANTVQNDYVQKVIKHASDQRMNAQEKTDYGDTIEISDAWW